jgi:cytochrome P450
VIALRAGLAFRRDPLRFLLSLDQGDDVLRFRVGLTDFTLVKNPETIRRILVTDADHYGEGKWTLRGERVMRDCLITRDGDPHRERRELLQPAFERRRLAGEAERLVEPAERVAASWREGDTVDARAQMSRIALTAAAETLFSFDLEPQAEALVPALGTMLTEVPRPGLPWPAGRGLTRARKLVDGTVRRAVVERRNGGARNGDALSLLMGLDDAEIADEVVSLLMAAVDTTPGTLAWTWYLLARHPEVEARLHEELDSVLDGRPPTADDIARLEYLELVLAEVLRLYPPVHFIDRRPLVDVELDGRHVAAGSYLLISPLLTHRDPRFYEEPAAFRPERERPRLAYLPFGAGPHTCIGMALARLELSFVIATLARRWRLHVTPDFPPDPSPQTTTFPMQLAGR